MGRDGEQSLTQSLGRVSVGLTGDQAASLTFIAKISEPFAGEPLTDPGMRTTEAP